MNFTYTDFLASIGIDRAHPGGKLATENWLKEIDLPPNSAILEVGCGTGKTLWDLASKTSGTLVGVDKHTSMIEHAKKQVKRIPKINVVKANTESLPFEDDSFDLIISESVTAFTHIEQSIQEYNRVLKPTGLLVMLEMTIIDELEQSEYDYIRSFYGIEQLLSEKEWLKVLKEKGFNHINVKNSEMYSEEELEIDPSLWTDKHFDKMAEHYAINTTYGHKIGANLYFCQR
ncbi:class I SAM-dependent methyltransferase [Aquibacillus kalidii]|uniref:class I SAM-dependent methyltransferase n=1 Tax=Aquibacillus kalidii TaxID=2762597 RepID=UPI00164581E0|nr:class I SAM-dependent methyltransferase [Aquibacillus kalidii]